MPVPGGGFDQAYNAQAAVDTDSLLVVAPALTQASNDKQQVVPMLEQLQALPQDWAGSRRCWPMPDTPARTTSTPARRPRFGR